MFQENRSLHEIVAKLEHNRGWLEERVETLENTINTINFATKVVNVEDIDQSKKNAN